MKPLSRLYAKLALAMLLLFVSLGGALILVVNDTSEKVSLEITHTDM